jgi:tRNA(Ile2) C34 agmatinyltransferase TiaS
MIHYRQMGSPKVGYDNGADLSRWETAGKGIQNMRVRCAVEHFDMVGKYGLVPGTCAMCPRCGHSTESFGESDASIKRCLVLMRKECPEGESNYYVDAEPEF